MEDCKEIKEFIYINQSRPSKQKGENIVEKTESEQVREMASMLVDVSECLQEIRETIKKIRDNNLKAVDHHPISMDGVLEQIGNRAESLQDDLKNK